MNERTQKITTTVSIAFTSRWSVRPSCHL